MHLVLHSDRGTLWISRSLWATRPTSELLLYLCCLLHTVWTLGWCLLGLEPCYTCVVVLHLCCCVTHSAGWCLLGLERSAPSPPFLCYQAITAQPRRSSPPRNYEYFVGPRCIQAASSTYHRLVSQISKPKKLSRAVVWGSSGLMQTCDLRLELEWAWSVTLPISGTPLRLEE